MSKLVIVDSPGKIMKLKIFLGTEYKIMASYGHIRDLPQWQMGFAEPDYTPKYVVTNPDVVNKLKAAVKGKNEVILATEPGRVGEFIAWHLKEVLGLQNPKRINIHKFAPSEVTEAFNTPCTIDDNLVKAHEARRVIDRIIGYRLSNATIGLVLENGLQKEISVNFPNGKYQREIEAALDHLAQGKAEYKTVLDDIVGLLNSELKSLQGGGYGDHRGRIWWPYHNYPVYY